jgi:SAM-dependent methyltransferase
VNLNLGCGEKQIENCFNVDFRKTSITDKVMDITEVPWPFKDEEFDNIYAIDILEHMLFIIPIIDECWRVVKPGGHLYIRGTYFNNEQSYRDVTHFHYFTFNSFDFLDPDTQYGGEYGWYTDKKWKVLDRDLDGNETVFDLVKI